MKKLLRLHPSNKINLLTLLIGLCIAVPLYTFMDYLLKKMNISSIVLFDTWLSFDSLKFKKFFLLLQSQSLLSKFILVQFVAIPAAFGFLATFFPVTVLLIRTIEPDSLIDMISPLFPVFVLLITFFDLLSSLFFLFMASRLTNFEFWMSYFVSISCLIRILLLFCLVVWICITGFCILCKKNEPK